MKKLSKALLSSRRSVCIASAALSAMLLSLSSHAAPIRIMAAGDSITEGYIDEDSSGTLVPFSSGLDDLNNDGFANSGDAPFQFAWRRQFVSRLAADGISFDMVGTKQAGVGFANGNDNDHQGAAGFQANAIQGEVAGALPSQMPDVGIILAGVNDIILANRNAAATFARITNIVSEFDNASSVDHIFLSTLTPIFPFMGSTYASIAGKEPVIDELNDLIRDSFDVGGIYFGRTDIHLVDGFAAFSANATNLPDGLHPSSSAYDALGNTFADEFLAVVPEPGTVGLAGLAALTLVTRKRRPLGA